MKGLDRIFYIAYFVVAVITGAIAFFVGASWWIVALVALLSPPVIILGGGYLGILIIMAMILDRI